MEYELVHEIKNLCRDSQTRDISFGEVKCDDPERYTRNLLKGRTLEITVERRSAGKGGGGWADAEIRVHADLNLFLLELSLNLGGRM